jgi:hypothetical protein
VRHINALGQCHKVSFVSLSVRLCNAVNAGSFRLNKKLRDCLRTRSLNGGASARGDFGFCKARDLLVLNDHDVADLLKAAVKREGSQTAFAKRYDVDRSELNSILNGRRRISASLAKALGLRRVYIVEEGEKHSERLCSLAAS